MSPTPLRSRRAALSSIALTAVAASAALTGCGSSTANDAGAPAVNTAGQFSGQTVTVAVTPTMPYIGLENGKLTGLDGDLFNQAAADLGLTVKPLAVDFPGLLAGVQSGRYDMGIGGISWTPERANAGIFTDPPYYSPAVLAVKPGVEARTVKDLEGKKLATVQSFFYIPALQKVPGATLQTYPTFQATLMDLSAGRVDIAFLDPLTVVYTKKKNPSLTYDTVTLEPPTEQEVAERPEYTAFQPSMSGWYLNNKSTKLRDALTEQIQGFYADGTATEAVKEWGGDPSGMLTPIPGFAAQRAKVDRDADWAPPSVG
jgi:polar amino acid transport system substrate-binding protein